MAFQDPFFEPWFIVLEREVPVFGFFLYGDGIAERAARIDQLIRTKRRSAFLTLITIRIFIAANGAGAYDVAVSEEEIGLLVIELFGFLLFRINSRRTVF